MFNFITCTFASLAIASALPAPGDDITGNVNQLVSLTVDGNPNTGNAWMIQEIPSELVYIDSNSSSPEDCTDSVGGCASQTTLNFYANNAGQGTLRLIYGQPWDKTYWEQKAYKVNISN